MTEASYHGQRSVLRWFLRLSALLCISLFSGATSLALQQKPAFHNAPRRPLVRRILSKVSRPIQDKLWPNTLPDLSHSEPLPLGPLGCPVRGLNAREASPEFGPGILFFRLFERLKRPTVLKFFGQRRGIAIVSGYGATKAVLSQEFYTVTAQLVPFSSKVVGTNDL